MRKIVFAGILIASVSGAALAQAQQQAAPAAKPAAKPATTAAAPAKPAPSKKPVKVSEVPPASKKQAIEEATPVSEPDPSIKLSEMQLAIAKTVYTGEIQCELGEKVTIRPMRREGFFFVSRGVHRFVMHPEESRTGAIRLEDPARGGLWLQLANKSMLMSQKEGKRLADECQSPQQLQYAKTMKPVNLLEAGK